MLQGSLLQLLVHRFPHELARGGGSGLLRCLPLRAGQQAVWGEGPQQAACGGMGREAFGSWDCMLILIDWASGQQNRHNQASEAIEHLKLQRSQG